MAIKFKAVERGEPGVLGGGDKKYFASAISSGAIDLPELTKIIERISTVSGTDVRAVLYAIVDVIPGLLADGKIVRLGELGSLQVSVESQASEKKEEVNASNIRKAHINFRPGSQLQEMLKTLSYQKER